MLHRNHQIQLFVPVKKSQIELDCVTLIVHPSLSLLLLLALSLCISSSVLSSHAWLQRVMDEVMSVWRLQLLQRNNDSELMLIRKKRRRKHNEGSCFIPLNHPPYLPLSQSAQSHLSFAEGAGTDRHENWNGDKV